MPSSANFDNSDLESIEGSTEEDEDIDQQSEAEEVLEAHDFDDRAAERNKWLAKNLQEKLKDVLEVLELKHPHRDDALSSRTDVDMGVVDDFKAEALLEPTKDEHFSNTPTALHIMAMCYNSEFRGFSRRVRKKVIQFLLERSPPKPAAGERPGAPDQGRSPADPVLMTAMKYNKSDDEFLENVRDSSTAEAFAALLEEKDAGGRNCLHTVFASWSGKFDNDERALTLRRAKLLVPLAKPTTMTAKSDEGNSPLHLALHYEQVKKRGSDYHDVVRLMVTKGDERGMADAFNNVKESPILFHKRTKKAYNKKVKEARGNQTASKQPAASSDKQAMPPPSKLLAQKAASSVAGAPSSPITTAKPSFDWPEKDQKDRKTKAQKNLPPGSADEIIGRGITKTLTGDPSKQPMDRSNRASARGSSRSAAAPDPVTVVVRPPPSVAETHGTTAAGSSSNKPAPGSSTAQPVSQPSVNKTKQSTSTASKTKTKEDSPKTADLIDFLEQHYIRNLSELEARDLIYGKVKVSDVNLSFDGTGLPNAKAIQTLIKFMKGGGGFSPTLASVRLPTVARNKREDPSEGSGPRKTYRANQKSSRSKGEAPREENPHPGRDELVAVFRELAEAGVKTIMRLEVDDLDAPPHSDVAIETALRPPMAAGGDDKGDSSSRSLVPQFFSIEVWNWKKPDLCIDVIEYAAPDVEEVNLYWSGNRSVLRGWSCEAGLPRLYSGKLKLSKVTIHAAPGAERLERMERDLRLFKTEVEASTKKNVKVDIQHRMFGLQKVSGGSKETREGGAPHLPADRQHAWIEHIESFRRQLVPIHQLLDALGLPPPPRVKVALIDDGMDLGSFQERDGVELTVQGLSCTSSTRKTPSPWYRSSQGHGTTMANMILRVNPWTSLYVMKLSDDISSDGNGTTIFADSAAQAIQAAVAREVDIISMSWTVTQKLAPAGVVIPGPDGSGDAPEPKDGVSKLQKAIEAAAKKGILMFCSASDKIEANAKDALPYGAAPNDILRIGAADALGQSDPLVESRGEINYFFPGKKVSLAYDPRAHNPLDFGDDASVDGSSVATALAAGLASLIKYCAVLVWKFYEDRPPGQDAGKKDTSAAASQIERNVLDRARVKMQRGQPDKFRSFAKYLSNRVYMEHAFNSIEAEGWLPESKKFLPVWGTFGKFTERMREGDHVVKMDMLEELILHLCTKFALVSSHSHGLSHRSR